MRSASSSTAVLLLAYGGPERLEEIGPFMRRLLGRDRLPPGLLERVEKKYRAIGGGSPLPGICRTIRARLAERLPDIPVWLAFRYTEPAIESVVAEIGARGRRRIAALSLSPHSSLISSRAYYETLEKAASEHALEVMRLEGWYRENAYNRLLADRIIETATANDLDLAAADTRLLFTAHNIPLSYLKEGDTYPDEIWHNLELLRPLLPAGVDGTLAWQSKGNAPGAWLEPEIEFQIEKLHENGCRKLLAVPISFSLDHLETLYDLDLELKEFCRDRGISLYRTRPANADNNFIAMLADFITRRKTAV